MTEAVQASPGRPRGPQKVRLTLWVLPFTASELRRSAFTSTSQGAVIDKIFARRKKKSIDSGN